MIYSPIVPTPRKPILIRANSGGFFVVYLTPLHQATWAYALGYSYVAWGSLGEVLKRAGIIWEEKFGPWKEVAR